MAPFIKGIHENIFCCLCTKWFYSQPVTPKTASLKLIRATRGLPSVPERREEKGKLRRNRLGKECMLLIHLLKTMTNLVFLNILEPK